MKIAILSDTHMPRMAKQLPKVLCKYLENADAIIHAGDWQTSAVYAELKQYAPVYGVTGNVDEKSLYNKFERSIILQFGNVKIGVTHGDGKGKTTEQRAMDAFSEEKLDLLIFGHSHVPLLKQNNGLTLFNPGSPTDKRKQSKYSFGILEINEGFSIRHVFYDSKE